MRKSGSEVGVREALERRRRERGGSKGEAGGGSKGEVRGGRWCGVWCGTVSEREKYLC